MHKPLEWIKENVVFPPQAGSIAGQKVGKYLLPFQVDFIKEILSPMGDIKKSAFIFGCRKISKTFLYSAILFYLLNDVRRTGFEIPIVASVYEQGKILYNQILAQINTEELKQSFIIRKDYFINKETQSKLHVVYNASTSNLGIQSSGAVFDEIGAYQDDSNLQTIQSGMSLSEQQPLLLMASNPPETPEHFVVPLIRACEKDSDFIVKKFALPMDKDWQSESSWCETNPFLTEWKRTNGAKFQNVMNNYRMLFRRALETKESELSFRRLQLGQSINANYLEYIPTEKIKFVREFDYSRKDIRWACGIDLSQSHDFTAVSFCGWKQQTDELFVKSFLYLPNTTTRLPMEKKRFTTWNNLGFIEVQNTEVLNANQIFDDVQRFLSKTNIKLEGIQIDPSLASHYIEYFEKNFKLSKDKMTGANCTQSIRELERIGNSGGLKIIGENHALIWMFQNVLVSQKSKNYVLMNRQTPRANIDGPVSISLGLKYLLDHPKKKFIIMSG